MHPWIYCRKVHLLSTGYSIGEKRLFSTMQTWAEAPSEVELGALCENCRHVPWLQGLGFPGYLGLGRNVLREVTC